MRKWGEPKHRRLRLWSNRSGAAAIEFALVVPILLLILLSTFEAGWLMMQSIMLDRALDKTVRELRIGSFDNPTQQTMRQKVCSEAAILADCEQTLALELIPILNPDSYPDDTGRCVNRGSAIQPVLRFNAGARSEIVFVRACYVVDPITPGLGLGLALPKDATGAFRLITKSGFVNEPA